MPRTNGTIAARPTRKKDELAACEARFRTIMTQSPYGVLIVDTGGCIRFGNRAAAAILGCTEEGLRGRRFDPPAEAGKTFEAKVQGSDGKTVVLDMWGEETEWDREQAWFVCLTDVTERRRSEELLRESEDKFSKAFQAAPALLSISTLAEGRYIEVNEALEKTLGYRREEIIGRTAAEIGIWENPAERERLVRLLKEGDKVRDVEVRLRSGTGGIVIGSLSAELINVQGEECIIALMRDVTAFKQAEDALRKSEKLFRATFNQAAVGIAHTSLDGRWLRVNQKFCDILGYSEEELMALDIRAITHPDDLERSAEYLQLMLEGKLGNYSLEKRYLRRDGSPVWVNVTVSMVDDPDGRHLFLVGVVEDISARKKIEAELRESERRYRSLFENMLEGFAYSRMLFDDRGRPEDFIYLNVNSAFSRLTGLDNVVGKKATEAIPGIKEAHPELLEIYGRVALTGMPETFEIEFEPLGKCFFVSVYSVQREHFVVVFDNITDRKRAEEALRKEKEKFSLAFLATPNMLAISSLADGRYIEVNEAFERFMGYRRDEVIGRTSLELNIWQNPADRAMVLQMLAEGKKVRDLEIGFRRKSGAIRVGLYSAEIIEIDGEQCLLTLVNDITERKRAEEELRFSEERYRRLYNETPVMLHSIDHEGRLVSVSNYWLEVLGYERNEVLGRSPTEFFTEASRRYAEEVNLPKFFRTGSCRDVPFQFVKKNGEILDVLLSAIAERDDEGKVVRSLSVIFDVTERKRAEEEIEKLNTDLAARAIELENANRELETFSYSVSHDLRKPLTVMSGYSQMIMEMCGGSLDEQCREYLQEINDGTWRMNELIDALLRFSCVARNELHRETVDLSGIANIVTAELALAEPGRRVTFRIGEGITANGDAKLLRLVMENLLGNAWKYTAAKDDASIEFNVTDIDGKRSCYVRDNGAGFAMAEAEKLFIPFQRLAGADEFKGHGIGLATVQRIVQRHGGRVWAEGEPGKGATFWFTLP
jgi:PAS domain S-box-containing protein